MMKLTDFGTLRIGLLTIALLVIILSVFADGNTYMHDWRIVPSVLAPSIMMMLVFAIPLEMTMTRIFITNAEPAEKARLQRILKREAIVYLLLIVSWTPFFIKVLG
jgi:hypothetical protein